MLRAVNDVIMCCVLFCASLNHESDKLPVCIRLWLWCVVMTTSRNKKVLSGSTKRLRDGFKILKMAKKDKVDRVHL